MEFYFRNFGFSIQIGFQFILEITNWFFFSYMYNTNHEKNLAQASLIPTPMVLRVKHKPRWAPVGGPAVNYSSSSEKPRMLTFSLPDHHHTTNGTSVKIFLTFCRWKVSLVESRQSSLGEVVVTCDACKTSPTTMLVLPLKWHPFFRPGDVGCRLKWHRRDVSEHGWMYVRCTDINMFATNVHNSS